MCNAARFLARFRVDPNNGELVNAGNYDRKSYSPLKQINNSNVKRLVPIWNASLMNDQGELAQPTVYDDVMYVINGKWTFAIDVETGRQIWRTPLNLEQGVTRAAIHRGAATIYNGKLFRVTIDDHRVALQMKTGEELWVQKFADLKDGFYSESTASVVGDALGQHSARMPKPLANSLALQSLEAFDDHKQHYWE